MDNTLFLVDNEKNYFYGYESQCLSPYSIHGQALHFMIKFCHFIHKKSLPRVFIKDEVKQAEKIIITDTVYDPCLYHVLTKYYQPENMSLYYMNIINQKNRKYMDDFPQRAYTFDQQDAKKYKLYYRHLPYSKNISIKHKCIKYDTLFLGIEKGRMNEIHEIAERLENEGLKVKIMVLDSSDPQYRISSYIHYPDYLEYVACSKTLLEINRTGQTGCTLRFLESLFLQKKLITTNSNIVDDPYYDSDNVFILGKDDLNNLSHFITQPYHDKQLDLSNIIFENWIKKW